MKKYTAIVAAVAASALSFTAQANSIIDGGLTFGITSYGANGSGFGNLNPAANAGVLTVNPLSATPVTGTDDLAPLTGQTPAFNVPILLYQAGIGSGGLFFSIVQGGNTYYFYETDQVSGTYHTHTSNGITTSSYEEDGDGYVVERAGVNNLAGAILAGGVGDAGTWTLQLSDTGRVGQDNQGGNANASFTFSPVPDGGLTVSLLGGSLLALSAVRRKFNR